MFSAGTVHYDAKSVIEYWYDGVCCSGGTKDGWHLVLHFYVGAIWSTTCITTLPTVRIAPYRTGCKHWTMINAGRVSVSALKIYLLDLVNRSRTRLCRTIQVPPFCGQACGMLCRKLHYVGICAPPCSMLCSFRSSM